MGRKNFGFTLIELLIVTATIGILVVLSFFTYKTQIAKGRDSKRKSDLAKIQRAFEDYMNDKGCYPNPEEVTTNYKICGQNFSPYLNILPCDPLNNSRHNFFYSYDENQSCKKWYKIYAKLEYEKDPIIEKVGCKEGCGPGNNYNYWVSSPNMMEVAQISPAEDWWPEIIGEITPPSGVSSTPTVVSSPTPSPTPYLICEHGYSYCNNGVCIGPLSSPPLSCSVYFCCTLSGCNCQDSCLSPPYPSPGITPTPINNCFP